MDVTDELLAERGVRVFKTDLFTPAYHETSGGHWSLRMAPLVVTRGYWSETWLVRDMPGLIRRDGSEASTWMSMSPREIESQEIGVRFATGHTVVMGMGMGWAAANTALQPAVTRVTVVERDPDVIALFHEQRILDQLPAAAASKVTIVQEDALAYLPDAAVDTLAADIWLPFNGDERVDEVRRMWANTRAERVYFWGQELVIARRARALGLPLDAATVARVVAEIGLPLLGPEMPDYPDMIARAAANTLKGD